MSHRVLVFPLQNPLCRTYKDAFSDDEDDEWIFNPDLDQVMIGGGAASPLLGFDLRPVEARQNWRNMLNRQRFEAMLRQRREIAPTDNLGQELTHAFPRSIEQQIATEKPRLPIQPYIFPPVGVLNKVK